MINKRNKRKDDHIFISFNFNLIPALTPLFILITQILHNILNGLLNIIDSLSHLINAAHYVGGHILKSLLHLFQ